MARNQGKHTLAQLIPVARMTRADAATLKEQALFIALGARIAGQVVRRNTNGRQGHPSTQGALHFLQGLAQECEGLARAIR